MAGEEFGAGLEIPNTPPVQQATPPVQTPAVSRALAEQLASVGLAVPADWDDTTIADRLVEMQERSEKATAYEARIQEFEAQQAQAAAAAASATAPSKPETPAQAAARQRKYERAILDQDAMAFVVPDPINGGYKPKDNLSTLHIRAARTVNEALSKRSRVSNDFVDDPYGTVAELTQDLLDAQNKAWEDRFKALETKFTPVEQQMALSAQQQVESAFVQTNKAKLFDAEGKPTPIYELVEDLYYEYGIPLDKALATAEKRLGVAAPTPAAPVVPQSISKVQKPAAPAQDRRFVAGVHPSRLQNVPDSGAPPTGRMNSFNDFYAKHPESRPGRRN